MPIKTDYAAGDPYDATDHNDENTQILANIPDDTAFASSWDGDTDTSPSKNAVYDILTSPYISSGSGSVGGSIAIPSGAKRAIIQCTTAIHATGTNPTEGQVTLMETGATAATVGSYGNSIRRHVIVTWSGSNINITGDTGGSATAYFYKF